MYLATVDEIDLTVAALAQEFAETAAYHDATAEFPFSNIARLRAAGIAALVVPKELGGRGFGLARAQNVVNRIARGEPSTALVLAQQYLFHAALARNPNFSTGLRERILCSAVKDGAFVNSLRVEPDLGTPARGGLPATIARKIPEGWSLNGRKIYATGAPVLDWYAVWARTEESDPRVGVFIVPAGAPGLRVEETWRHMGMRASGSHDVLFENAIIPRDHAAEFVAPEQRLRPDPVQVAWMSVLFSTIYDGIARAARDWFIAFLRDRKPSNLGASLATLPRMQEAVGAIESALHVNRVLLTEHSARVDRGETPAAQESFYLKHNVTNNAILAVGKAVELAGNPGLSQNNALERHYRDVLCGRIHSPQDDSILLGGGREALTAAGAFALA